MQLLSGENLGGSLHCWSQNRLCGRLYHDYSCEKFRVWNAPDLRHFKTVVNSQSYINDCVYMPNAKKLVVSALDRSVSKSMRQPDASK